MAARVVVADVKESSESVGEGTSNDKLRTDEVIQGTLWSHKIELRPTQLCLVHGIYYYAHHAILAELALEANVPVKKTV